MSSVHVYVNRIKPATAKWDYQCILSLAVKFFDG